METDETENEADASSPRFLFFFLNFAAASFPCFFVFPQGKERKRLRKNTTYLHNQHVSLQEHSPRCREIWLRLWIGEALHQGFTM